MKHIFFNSASFVPFPEGIPAKLDMSGYIRDAGSGETLIGATCYVPELQTGGTSNQYGFYSLTLPDGVYTIRIFVCRLRNPFH
jgi:hypothetical protein